MLFKRVSWEKNVNQSIIRVKLAEAQKWQLNKAYFPIPAFFGWISVEYAGRNKNFMNVINFCDVKSEKKNKCCSFRLRTSRALLSNAKHETIKSQLSSLLQSRSGTTLDPFLITTCGYKKICTKLYGWGDCWIPNCKFYVTACFLNIKIPWR